MPQMEFDNPQLEVDNQAPENENTQSSIVDQEDNVEDEAERKLNHLFSVFPNVDPKFLPAKVQEFCREGR